MNENCGCCEGTEILTPGPIANRPGLDALTYRVGTHASFLETMKARLGNFFLDLPPGEASFLLAAADLKDPAELANRLVSGSDPLAQYIFRFFASEIQETLKSSPPAADWQAALLLGLNTIIQGGTPIYNRQAFEQVSFSAETKHLLSQNPSPTGPRLQELNRALLGDGFPDEIARPAKNYPLRALTTRASDDFTIALLDSWATVADVLAFYQERIANEGYLRTATERRSILELARLIGYTLRPGVSASTYLAYTLEKEQIAAIPVGSKAQSIPGPGEKAQTFETSDPLKAHVSWNALKPRPTQPQFLTFYTLNLTNQVYLKGIATNLKPNDALLVDYGSPGQQVFKVEAVLPDAPRDRTLVKLQVPANRASLQRVDTTSLETVGGLGRFAPFGLTGFAAALTSPPNGTQIIKPTVSSLGSLVDALKKPPSLPPPNSKRLVRDPRQVLTAGGDIYYKLLPAIRPELATVSASAWRSADITGAVPAKVYALRLKAGVFGNNAPKKAAVSVSSPPRPPTYQEWDFTPDEPQAAGTFTENGSVIWLDAPYDQVKPGSWLVIEQPNRSQIVKAGTVTFASRAQYGIAGKSTGIKLVNPNLVSAEAPSVSWIDPLKDSFSLLRNTTVYTQSEELTLAEEILGGEDGQPVCGNQIELDDFYDGLDTGRWLIISGERADIPGTSGIKVSELLMLAGVEQRVQQVGIISGQTVSGKAGTANRLIGLTPATKIIVDGVEKPDFELLRGQNVQVQSHLDASGQLIADLIFPVDKSSNQLAVSPSLGLEIDSGMIIAVARDHSAIALEGVLDRPEDKTHSFLRLSQTLAYCYKRDTVTIYGNVVKATHGETRPETLGSGDGSKALQTFVLRQPPLTFVSANTPSGAQSTLKVYVNQVEWHEVDTLADLKPTDRNFITKTDDAGKTSVIFGNGKQGARPPTGSENVKAVYRNGIGKPGNVRARQISLLVSRPLGVKEVINPLPGTGGADPESRDRARKNAPLAVMALDRLVSVQDYEDFTRTFAGIGKARAQQLSNEQRRVVLLTIAGEDDIPIAPTSDLYQNLKLALHTYGDPNMPISIKVRELLALVISAGVRLQLDYVWEWVEPQIRAKLLDTFSFERRELGQTVRLSEVISAIQAVRGVAYVDVDLLRTLDEETIKKQLEKPDGPTDTSPPSSPPANPPSLFGATTGLDTITEQLSEDVPVRLGESDKTNPGEFKPAQLAYLLPNVPDTLILRELK